MLESINEVAVLGATFLMMGLASLWYSPLLFGKMWMQEIGVDESEKPDTSKMLLRLAVTFLVYFVLLLAMAQIIVFISGVALQPIAASGYILLFVLGLTSALAVWENRSLNYILINSGFYVLFVLGGTYIIQLWPW